MTDSRRREIAYVYMRSKAQREPFDLSNEGRLRGMAKSLGVPTSKLVEAAVHLNDPGALADPGTVQRVGRVCLLYMQHRIRVKGLEINHKLRRKIGGISRDTGIPKTELNHLAAEFGSLAAYHYLR